MSGFLDQAFAEAERRVRQWRQDELLLKFRGIADARRPRPGFAAALRAARPVALIAEFKRSSPSSGVLADSVDVAQRAKLYIDAGATAVSVLTEPRWFQGAIDDLLAARRATPALLLRKDFIVDEYDLEVSAAMGADAVLLIAARFAAARLRELLCFAAQLGLEALVETHDEFDAAVACESGAAVIGVNSRNLQTLQVDVNAALLALQRIPSDRVRVCESGIQSPRDVGHALRAGADAILVGELLMRSRDPATTIRSLLSKTESVEAMAAPKVSEAR